MVSKQKSTINPMDPATWERRSDIAKALEEAAVNAEWESRHDEADRLLREALDLRAEIEVKGDLIEPF